MNCLLFADDIALVGDNMCNPQALCDIAQEHALANTYKFGVRKCAHIAPATEAKLHINEQDVPKVFKFKYLGVYFDRDGINPTICVNQASLKAEKAV